MQGRTTSTFIFLTTANATANTTEFHNTIITIFLEIILKIFQQRKDDFLQHFDSRWIGPDDWNTFQERIAMYELD